MVHALVSLCDVDILVVNLCDERASVEWVTGTDTAMGMPWALILLSSLIESKLDALHDQLATNEICHVKLYILKCTICMNRVGQNFMTNDY